MAPTSPTGISIEQLGFALDALGWRRSSTNSRAASRTEMLGLLRFIVEAELHKLDDPDSEEEATQGYMLGLDTRAQDGTSTQQEYALAYITLWLNLVADQVLRVGGEVMAALQSVDTDYGTDQIARALADALKQLLRVPATMDPAARKAGSAPVVRRTLEETRQYLQEARQHLEDSRRELKRRGF